jgi:hypothetical protein
MVTVTVTVKVTVTDTVTEALFQHWNIFRDLDSDSGLCDSLSDNLTKTRNLGKLLALAWQASTLRTLP